LRIRLLLASLVVAVAGLAAACAGESGPVASDGGNLELFDEAVNVTLAVALSEFEFDPEALELPAGQLTSITITNDGSTEHDFTIKRLEGEVAFRLSGEPPSNDRSDGADVHVALRPGTSAELRIRAAEPGEYELYCAVSGHRRAGMRTTLTVQ